MKEPANGGDAWSVLGRDRKKVQRVERVRNQIRRRNHYSV
jgi:hypothetical protein